MTQGYSNSKRQLKRPDELQPPRGKGTKTSTKGTGEGKGDIGGESRGPRFYGGARKWFYGETHHLGEI